MAEERARVAREIHDGLAQYLFAVSTHASMLENGADPAKIVAAALAIAVPVAAGRSARFAVPSHFVVGHFFFFFSTQRFRRYVDTPHCGRRLDVELWRPDSGTSGWRRTSRSRSSGSSRRGSRTGFAIAAQAPTRLGSRSGVAAPSAWSPSATM